MITQQRNQPHMFRQITLNQPPLLLENGMYITPQIPLHLVIYQRRQNPHTFQLRRRKSTQTSSLIYFIFNAICALRSNSFRHHFILIERGQWC